jgi:WD40 repeat protein
MRFLYLLLAALLVAGCEKAGPHSRELYNRLLNVRSLAFSPDGSQLVGGRNRSSDHGQGDLLVWDLKARTDAREIQAHGGDVVDLLFTSDGLISAGADGQVKIWDSQSWTSTRQLPGERWLQNMRAGLTVLRGQPIGPCFLPRGAALEVWEADGSKPERRWPAPDAQALAASDDGSCLATLMTNGSIVIWDDHGKRQNEIAGPFSCLDLSADGKTLASGDKDGAVMLWETGSGKANLSPPSLHKRIKVVRFSPDGQRVAAGCEGQLVISSGARVLWELKVDSYASPSVLAFSSDGHQLASSGASKVLLWDGL